MEQGCNQVMRNRLRSPTIILILAGLLGSHTYASTPYSQVIRVNAQENSKSTSDSAASDNVCCFSSSVAICQTAYVTWMSKKECDEYGFVDVNGKKTCPASVCGR